MNAERETMHTQKVGRREITILPAPTTDRETRRMARQAMAELLRVRAILEQNAEHASRNPR